MFNVYGDDIVLESVKIGELKGGWPGLRDRAVSYLEGTFEGYVSEDDHCAEVEKAREEGYKDGEIDASESHDRELDEAEAKGDREGFKRGVQEGREAGYKVALVDIPHAADAERINLLLASCNKVHALLALSLRQPAKEAKQNVRTAYMELQEAARRYARD